MNIETIVAGEVPITVFHKQDVTFDEYIDVYYTDKGVDAWDSCIDGFNATNNHHRKQLERNRY